MRKSNNCATDDLSSRSDDQSVQKKSIEGLHAHFDCFSGAAGDMMLAACLDAAGPDSTHLLSQVLAGLKTIPTISHEFDCYVERVIRGSGCIAAKKLHVTSIYQHRPAPIIPAHQDASHLHRKTMPLTTPDDVKDMPIPEWKRKALQIMTHSSANAAPFGGSWELESSLSVVDLYNENDDKLMSSEAYGELSTVLPSLQKIESITGSQKHAASEKSASNISHNHNHSHSHASTHDHSHSHHHHSHDHSHSTHTGDHEEDGPLRNLQQITYLIQNSKLPLRVKKLSILTFQELAKAEAHTHGMPSLDQVHFHEVGAIDSIVDTVGTILALDLLNVTSITCSRLPLGEGTVMTAHGLLPVPAPATLRLLIDMHVCPGPPGITGELVTPTAAALLKVLSSPSCPFMANSSANGSSLRICRPPQLVIKSVGIGAGTKNFSTHPNIFRLILGERVKLTPLGNSIPAEVKQHDQKFENPSVFVNKNTTLALLNPSRVAGGSTSDKLGSKISDKEKNALPPPICSPWVTDRLVHIETNIDDATPEVLAYTIQKLLEAGSIDAWIHPIVMKKGRSAHTLHCLCHDDKKLPDGCSTTTTLPVIEGLLNIIFRQTTTFGVRIHRDIERIALHRQFLRRVQTPYGNSELQEDGCVDVKLGMLGGEIVTISAEFDHCKRVADAVDMPLRVIAESAIGIARREVLQQK